MVTVSQHESIAMRDITTCAIANGAMARPRTAPLFFAGADYSYFGDDDVENSHQETVSAGYQRSVAHRGSGLAALDPGLGSRRRRRNQQRQPGIQIPGRPLGE